MSGTEEGQPSAEGLRLVVKPTAGGDKLTLEGVEPSASVEDVKRKLAPLCGIPAEEQRLIYKGQILKDERTVDSYGIGNDNVLHLVRGKPQGSTQSSGGGAAAASGSLPAPNAANPMGGMMSPEAMQSLMSSPMMAAMMDNPELLRGMMQAQPGMREVMDRNPEIAHALNDPAMLREAMRLMANPALMREHMRNTDRAMSNLEAMPGGFNALRQLFENVQEPLAAASAAAGSEPAGGAGGGGASTTGGSGAPPAASPSETAPLPNPWAAPAATGAGAAAGAGGMPDLSALLGGMGGAGGGGGMPGGFPGMMGGGPGGQMDMSAAMQMMQAPGVADMMASMMAQPGMVDALLASNPALQQMAASNPALRSMLGSPEALRAMMSPQSMAAMAQMQAAMQGNPMLASMLGGGGMPGGAAGAGGGGAAPDLGALAAMLGGLGGGMPGTMGGLGVPNVANPEQAYASQLQQLEAMGFFDRQSNIAALQATGGNVNAAVDRLLQM